MYLALGENTKASTGKWVLMNRRWVCISSPAIASGGMMRRSTQGESLETSMPSAPLKMSWLTICWVQVVPGLRVGGNDDVIVAKLEVVPHGRVHVVVVHFPALLRPGGCGHLIHAAL